MVGAKPGGWWYGVAGVVAAGAVVVTGVLGVARATDLVAEVDDFQRLDGPGTTSVSVVEPGEYAVYHEEITRGVRSTADADGFVLTVVGPDGAEVPVRPSDVRYGWGSRQAEAIGSFDATQAGLYVVQVDGDYGQLAFGRHIPGAPLYGLGPALLVAAAVVAGCFVGAIVVGRRRRAGAGGEGREGSDGSGSGGGSRTPVVVGAVTAVVLVVGVGAVVLVGRTGDDATDVLLEGAQPRSGAMTTSTSAIECTSDADFETGLCGLSPEELREMNLAYADRLEFTGDLDAANAVAEQARTALAPIAGVLPQPSVEQVREALAPVSADVSVIDNAVRTAGTAFGIGVDGGCVFGTVHSGTVEVEIGGYVNDGGCLAAYGH